MKKHCSSLPFAVDVEVIAGKFLHQTETEVNGHVLRHLVHVRHLAPILIGNLHEEVGKADHQDDEDDGKEKAVE